MSEAIPYLKMNGLGNDFVVIDARKNGIKLDSKQIARIADRNGGIGCDQLIIMEKADAGGADIFMRIYNQSGGEVDACGNATRCIAALLAHELKRENVVVATNVGTLPAKVEGDMVHVDMGEPLFGWQQIPLSEEFADTRTIELQVGPIDDPILHTPSVVNVGNPHAVFWVDRDPDDYELERFGPLLENHPIFPERANISLAQIVAPDEIKVRVWERGVGETRACGTGACAVAVSAARTARTGRLVNIDLPGGRLSINWRGKDNHVIMSGPWALDGEGVLPQELVGHNNGH